MSCVLLEPRKVCAFSRPCYSSGVGLGGASLDLFCVGWDLKGNFSYNGLPAIMAVGRAMLFYGVVFCHSVQLPPGAGRTPLGGLDSAHSAVFAGRGIARGGSGGLWACGLVGLWACGLVGLWACGLVGLWACGLVGLWACGLVKPSDSQVVLVSSADLWCRQRGAPACSGHGQQPRDSRGGIFRRRQPLARPCDQCPAHSQPSRVAN